MILNVFGEIAQKYLPILPIKYPQVSIDNYTVMPNHVHAIFQITDMSNNNVGVIHELPLQGNSKQYESLFIDLKTRLLIMILKIIQKFLK